MKKQFSILLFICSWINIALGGTVSEEKAKAVGQAFLNARQASHENKRTSDDLQLIYTDHFQTNRGTEPAYFIFTSTSGKGFVIVAGDDAVEPILGYSHENTIDPSHIPENFKYWVEQYKEQIAFVKSKGFTPTRKIKDAWDNKTRTALTAIPVVSPLIQSKWNQGDPYNIKCPGGSPTGCVATAMGQIMRYWNYPTSGNGSHSYKPSSFPTQSANFGGTVYNWANMPNALSSSSLADYKNAVGTLLYHCGVSVNMEYNPSGSGALFSPVRNAYVNYFRYESNMTTISRSNYTAAEWLNQMKIQLNAFLPVQFAGGTHSWICDGYDSEDGFSMNWGWGGLADGYYRLDDLTPLNSNYNSNVQAVVNISKPNRLQLSAVTSSVSAVCATTSFTCSVSGNSQIAFIAWTVPAGWKVGSTVSTGLPILGFNNITISTPANYAPTGGTVIITASGLTSYGERTPLQFKGIGTGKPGFSYFPDPFEHLFSASAGAIIQHSSNGTSWTNAGNQYSVFTSPGVTKTIYIRASSTCGVSASKKYVLTGKIENLVSHLEDGDPMPGITITPNPASDNIHIQSMTKIKAVTCMNSIGQTVPLAFHENCLRVEHLQKGMYLLHITDERGRSVIKKFMKE